MGVAAQGKRPPAADFHAFSQFTHDLEACLKGVNQLLTLLEQELGVDGERAYKRHEAKKLLPQIVRPPEEYFSITQALQAEGKTIDRIELGSRKDDEEVHSSETPIFYFTDGSIRLGHRIKAWNLPIDDDHLQPSDFHWDFNVTWVQSMDSHFHKLALFECTVQRFEKLPNDREMGVLRALFCCLTAVPAYVEPD
jgi:hypothetical protein